MRRFRRKVAVHVGVLSVVGAMCLALGSTTSSAAPTVQDGRFLTAETVDFDYSCSGADVDSSTVLGALGLNPFPLEASITSVAVDPSPSPDESFDIDFIWDFTIPDALVDVASGLTPFVDVTGDVGMAAVSGATGGPLVADTGPTHVLLGDGTVPVGYTEGPFTGTFTRTALVDEPIVFEPTDISSAIATESGIVVLVNCVAQGEPTLTVVDETGIPPTTTTTTRPAVVTTTAPPTTAAVGGAGAGQGEQLPVTGSTSNLFLVFVAIALIDLGYLAKSASKAIGRRPASVS